MTDLRRALRGIGLALPALVSCGYNFQVNDGLKAPCNENQIFFTDLDGDGFGDPEGPSEALCLGDQDRGLTVTNDNDCDDSDASNTARIGALCPQELVGASGAYMATAYDRSEFVAGHAETEVRTAPIAHGLCEDWAGADVGDAGSTPRGGLASFDSPVELSAVEDALDDTLTSTEDYAAFVAVRWSGTWTPGEWASSVWTPGHWNGGWSWEQPSTITDAELPWCGQEPEPGDLFPSLNPEDEDQLALILTEMGRRRLALIRRAGTWCLGIPSADLNAAYTPTAAHYVCERQAP